MSAGVVLRQCSSCKATKPLQEFHKNRTKSLGHGYTCKKCKNAFGKSSNGKWKRKPSRKISLDLYNKSPQGRITQNSYKHRARLKPEVKQKDRARVAVKRAVEQGIIVRPEICSQCPNTGLIEAHHHNGYDYEHWLDVIWLCKKCHLVAG